MGGALHPGVARGGASFELERLELDDGRLVVRGWWSGVRGMRFLRPALVVNGQRVLATLEHKPWAAGPDGEWAAAFPWKKKGLDVAGVTLVVAPSVEVPLDRDEAPLAVVAELPLPRPPAARTVEEVAGVRDAAAAAASLGRERAVDVGVPPLRAELDGVERQLDAMHAELRESRAHLADRDERCRELEHSVARERRSATKTREADDEFVRAHAMAVMDRDRALAQHEEAVADREAAVRSRKRMERQRDEALAERAAAEAARVEALAERDEARRQRDELLLAHGALQARMRRECADAEETAPLHLDPPDDEADGAAPAPAARRASRDGAAPTGQARPRPAEQAPSPATPRAAADAPSSPARHALDGEEKPIGVRKIPAVRAVGAQLHRAEREREHAVTPYDMWAIRVFGSIAAIAFISLLVMILKAFFVF